MTRIVITGSGTLGDHLPMIGLGRSLADRSHTVLMAFNQAMLGHAERAGLDVVRFGYAFGPEQARDAAWTYDQWNAPGAQQQSLYQQAELFAVQCERLAKLCKEWDAELLIAPVNDPAGAIVHEMVGVPWITSAIMPAAFCAASEASPRTNGEPMVREYLRFIQAVRKLVGLKERPIKLRSYDCSRLSLLASSPHFSLPPPQDFPDVKTTGFWFYDHPEMQEWQPDMRVQRFMERHPRPLALSFSSLPVENPKHVLDVHVRAAAMVGRPLLAQQGWAGFGTELAPFAVDSDEVMIAGFIPHDWLFARAEAVMTHGGIGTLARALRNDCPVVVEPYGNDQFFNALRVVQLGVGVAMRPHRLTAEGLARALETKIAGGSVRTRAAELGARIRQERGLETACDLVEEWVA